MRSFFLQYLTYFIVGGTGVLINLLVAWGLTTYVFGIQHYFYGYLVGTALNLLYIFTLHTVHTFKTTHDHGKRFSLFALYHLGMTTLQASIVNIVTASIGTQYYLFVIGSVIFCFSIVTFLVFRFKLFTQGPLRLANLFGTQNEKA